jgi:hypothetical protein
MPTDEIRNRVEARHTSKHRITRIAAAVPVDSQLLGKLMLDGFEFQAIVATTQGID